LKLTAGISHIALLVILVIVCRTQPILSETLLQDEFDSFELGGVWKEHELGPPDVLLEIANGDMLLMRSSGTTDGFFGIETASPVSLQGLDELIVDARVKPENAGVEGTVAAAEVALLGQSGQFVRAFASNNAGPEPETVSDWGDHYEDSAGNVESSGPWPHCDAACDAVRNLVVSVTPTGTTLKAFDDLDDPDAPTWETSFDNFTLADLGPAVTIALRQLAVDGGDDAIGFFDSILVTGVRGVVLPGDFSGNGILDAADIDLLSTEVRLGNNPVAFDLNGDAAVNQQDRAFWIDSVKKTWLGDSNLDGVFSSADFVAIFQVGEYEDGNAGNSGWSDGDWNGDAEFDTADFVIAFQAGGYEKGPRPAAVPEPASCLLILIGGYVSLSRRRRLRLA
jgi:hypothetical protein